LFQFLLLALCGFAANTPGDTTASLKRSFRLEVVVKGSPQSVYQLWTTEAGAEKFLAPRARIEPQPGGRYEMIFDPDMDPDGSIRGTKGCRVVRIVPDQELVFEWIAFVGQQPRGRSGPPYLPEPERSAHKTRVVVRFSALPGEPEHTRVALVNDGFGSGAKWDEAFAYFRDRGWPQVLAQLKAYCDHGQLAPWAK